VEFIGDETAGRFVSFGATTELALTNHRDPTHFRFFADRPSTWADLAISLADSPVSPARFLDGNFDSEHAATASTPCQTGP
jgi:hypothetical protein